MSESNGKSYGSGSGTTRLYAIEARSTVEPQVVNGIILTKAWSRIYIHRITGGQLAYADPRTIAAAPMVPGEKWQSPSDHLVDGLARREQAVMLAQRFHMQADGEVALCIETRIVEVEVKYSFSSREVGVGEAFSFFESSRRITFAPRDDEATRPTTSKA